MTKTDKQLEMILLAKAVRRFRKTSPSKIEHPEPEHDDVSESETYSIDVHGIEIKLSYHKRFHENEETCTLSILNEERYSIKYFNSTYKEHREYIPILMRTYWETKERVDLYNQKRKKKNSDWKAIDKLL